MRYKSGEEPKVGDKILVEFPSYKPWEGSVHRIIPESPYSILALRGSLNNISWSGRSARPEWCILIERKKEMPNGTWDIPCSKKEELLPESISKTLRRLYNYLVSYAKKVGHPKSLDFMIYKNGDIDIGFSLDREKESQYIRICTINPCSAFDKLASKLDELEKPEEKKCKCGTMFWWDENNRPDGKGLPHTYCREPGSRSFYMDSNIRYCAKCGDKCPPKE